MVEFNLTADHMPETLLKRLGSVEAGRRPVGADFLQPRCTMADATEQEVIEAQELEPDVPPNRLARVSHGVCKLDHVLVDAQRHVTSRSIPMRKVSVLVCQHRTGGMLVAAGKQAGSHHERTSSQIPSAVTVATAFLNGNLGSGSDADL